MSHRITNHRTLIRHYIAPLFLYCLCCVFNKAWAADDLFINVYLKLDNKNTFTALIKKFNHTLTTPTVSNTDVIRPYIEQHPAHITLYLTHYNKKNIPRVLEQVQQLAQHESPLLLTSERIAAYDTYVMLHIKNNSTLQQLHTSCVHRLKELRAKDTPIPAWAAADMQQQQLHALYGSPGVLTRYNPHISIVQINNFEPEQHKILIQQLKHKVHVFNQQETVHRETLISALAVGIANKEGQIIKELASFPLT